VSKVAVASEGVEYRQCVGQSVLGLVVVCHNYVQALGHGVVDFVKGLDSAVKGDKYFGSEFYGPVDACFR
jgi:hypothetical protein